MKIKPVILLFLLSFCCIDSAVVAGEIPSNNIHIRDIVLLTVSSLVGGYCMWRIIKPLFKKPDAMNDVKAGYPDLTQGDPSVTGFTQFEPVFDNDDKNESLLQQFGNQRELKQQLLQEILFDQSEILEFENLLQQPLVDPTRRIRPGEGVLKKISTGSQDHKEQLLLKAFKENNTRFVIYLLQKGIDPKKAEDLSTFFTQVSYGGGCPYINGFHWAFRHANRTLIELLLDGEYGFGINDIFGISRVCADCTPLDTMCLACKGFDCFEFLVEKGAKVTESYCLISFLGAMIQKTPTNVSQLLQKLLQNVLSMEIYMSTQADVKTIELNKFLEKIEVFICALYKCVNSEEERALILSQCQSNEKKIKENFPAYDEMKEHYKIRSTGFISSCEIARRLVATKLAPDVVKKIMSTYHMVNRESLVAWSLIDREWYLGKNNALSATLKERQEYYGWASEKKEGYKNGVVVKMNAYVEQIEFQEK